MEANNQAAVALRFEDLIGMKPEPRRSIGRLGRKTPNDFAILFRVLPDAEGLRGIVRNGEPFLQRKALVERCCLANEIDPEVPNLIGLGGITGSKIGAMAQEDAMRFEDARRRVCIVKNAQAEGQPASVGVETTMGYFNDDQLLNGMTEAAQSAYDVLMQRYRSGG